MASVDRVNPVATTAKAQITSPYQVLSAREDRRRRRDEDREPYDTVELHAEADSEDTDATPTAETAFEPHGIDLST